MEKLKWMELQISSAQLTSDKKKKSIMAKKIEFEKFNSDQNNRSVIEKIKKLSVYGLQA